MMYRVLIADDEKTERECIYFLLRRMNADLEIRQAEDGEEALAILTDFPADILFTDVQMPRMDGLELIAQAQKILPDIKVLIFSGYADFEYARTAIRLGVENYILKPVVPEDLVITMDSLLQELNARYADRQAEAQQQSYLLHYALMQLITGKTDEPDPALRPLLKENSFRLMILINYTVPFLEENYRSYCDALKEHLMIDFEPLNLASDELLLLFRDSPSSVSDLAGSIVSFTQDSFDVISYAAVSAPLSEYRDLRDAFSFVEQEMEQRFWAPDEHSFLPRSAKTSASDTLNFGETDIIASVRAALESKDPDLLRTNLDVVYQNYAHPGNQSQIFTKFLFSNLVTALYPSLPVSLKEQSLDEMISFIYSRKNIESIVSMVRKLSDAVLEELSALSPGMRHETQLIKNFIDQNYSSDFSIKELAAKIYLSPDYASRIFKKDTGLSISQYLKSVRMETAREALINTNKKVVDIVFACGYNNYSYFCQSFREFYGTSPERYRLENRKGGTI